MILYRKNCMSRLQVSVAATTRESTLLFRAPKKIMKALGKTYEPVVCEGAGHGFMRVGEAPEATEGNRKARDEAWVKVKKLLAGE